MSDTTGKPWYVSSTAARNILKGARAGLRTPKSVYPRLRRRAHHGALRQRVPFALIDRTTTGDTESIYQFAVWPGQLLVSTSDHFGLPQYPTINGNSIDEPYDDMPLLTVTDDLTNLVLRVQYPDPSGSGGTELQKAELVLLTDDDIFALAPSFYVGYLRMAVVAKDTVHGRLDFYGALTGNKTVRKVNTTFLWGAL